MYDYKNMKEEFNANISENSNREYNFINSSKY